MTGFKKILTLHLIAILLISHVGYYFLYTIKQQIIKEQAKHKLLLQVNENVLEHFEITDSRIVWEDEDKEFSVNGKMYDVAAIKCINNKKYILALSDDKETDLLSTLYKTNQEKSNTKQQKESKHSIKLQTISFTNIPEIIVANMARRTKVQFPILQQNSITTIRSINIPPPKFS